MYTKVKGTNDILCKDAKLLSSLEYCLRHVVSLYGFEEIRIPILTSTELIHRSSGDGSDIVTKETFDFEDRGGRSITLRPEGTAPILRAVIENKLYTKPLPLKLFYIGDMFRYERPQKGRYREFSQFGVEVIGSNSPFMDGETISMASTIFSALGIKNYKVRLNTLGDKASREAYRKALKEYFAPHLSELCEDCKKRYETNPLRILDCKVDHDSEILKNVPKIRDYLSSESKNEFEAVKAYLSNLHVPFYEDMNLVRGLDYYTNTVFEIEMDGADIGQSLTICAGGRYNDLMKQLDGPDMGCIGFAFGLERLMAILPDKGNDWDKSVICQLIPLGADAKAHLISLMHALRLNGMVSEMDYEAKNLKQHFRSAENNRARFIIICGDEELKNGSLQIKNKINNTEVTIKESELMEYIVKSMSHSHNHECCGEDCNCSDEECNCSK